MIPGWWVIPTAGIGGSLDLRSMLCMYLVLMCCLLPFRCAGIERRGDGDVSQVC